MPLQCCHSKWRARGSGPPATSMRSMGVDSGSHSCRPRVRHGWTHERARSVGRRPCQCRRQRRRQRHRRWIPREAARVMTSEGPWPSRRRDTWRGERKAGCCRWSPALCRLLWTMFPRSAIDTVTRKKLTKQYTVTCIHQFVLDACKLIVSS